MSDPERVFNTFRRKPYRPFYSLREFQAGLVISVILFAVVGWIVWHGAHAEEALFTTQENLLTAKGAKIPVYKRPLERWVEPGGVPTKEAASPNNALEPFPSGVISEGWKTASSIQTFDETNLYKKIDGREDFYKSFGFQKLYFLSLESTARKDLTLDIELFDLGSIENALGALSAEISDPHLQVTMQASGLSYLAPNGGFVSQGRYYVRMIGSEDNELIREKVQDLQKEMTAHLPAEKIPWPYALFVGGLGTQPGQIRYQRENAFSFGFAKQVYSATVPGSKDTEVFITKQSTPTDAANLAKQFAQGFGGYETAVKSPAGHSEAMLYQNEMIHAFEGVQTYGNFVLGIRFATSPEDAIQWMEKLKSALRKLDAG